jgi:hypothetical protein
MVQAALEVAFEWLVDLVRRATYGDKGTVPNHRRLFWFRIVDLLLAIHLAYVILVLFFGYEQYRIHILCAPLTVALSGIGFFFCFLVGVQGEYENGSRRYAFLSILALVIVFTGFLAAADRQ